MHGFAKRWVFLCLLSLFPFSSAADDGGGYCCACTMVSSDKEYVGRYKVWSELAIDCNDYNGVDVPFENPQPGPMRSPGLLAELAACSPCSKQRVPKYKVKDYGFSYWLQPDDPHHPRP